MKMKLQLTSWNFCAKPLHTGSSVGPEICHGTAIISDAIGRIKEPDGHAFGFGCVAILGKKLRHYFGTHLVPPTSRHLR